jgi:hypothetical protein
MSFDEQLRQALDTLSDRLRETIGRDVRTIVDELAAAARADRDRAADEAARNAGDAARTAADEAVRQATEAARAATDDAERRAADAERRAAEAERKADEATRKAGDEAAATQAALRAVDQSARERLLDAVRAIDRAPSLTEIFDALAAGAGREAPRAAVLLVRDAGLRTWRFSGFPASVNAAHDTELTLRHAGVVGQAIASLTPVSAERADPMPSAPFDLPNGRRRVAVPLAMSGHAVAVVYADEGPADDPDRGLAAGWEAAVEILARHAARALEVLTAFKAARSLSERGAVLPITSGEVS